MTGGVEGRPVAVMFPGQGTQRLGMGRHLERIEAGARVFDVVSEVTGRDVRELCFAGPAAVQTRTENAQVAVFTCNAAAFAVLADAGVDPVCALGHSVGELNALQAAGVLSLEEAARLVAARGALMGAITTPGTMLAVLGLDLATVVGLCEQASDDAGAPVVAALRNGPANVVASGASEAVDALEPLAVAAGAVKVTRLVVSHAFHSPLMADAVDAWRGVVSGAELAAPRIPVLLNTTGRAATGVDDIRSALVDQLTGPVRWVDDVLAAIDCGAEGFVEAGDSKTLSGLVRAVDATRPTHPMNDPRTVRRLRTPTPAPVAG